MGIGYDMAKECAVNSLIKYKLQLLSTYQLYKKIILRVNTIFLKNHNDFGNIFFPYFKSLRKTFFKLLFESYKLKYLKRKPIKKYLAW